MRKRYLIDRSLQFRTTFLVVGTVLIFFALLAGGAGIYLSCNNSVLVKSINRLDGTALDQQHIISGLQQYGDFSKREDRRIVSNIISRNLKENNITMNNTIQAIRNIIDVNGLILGAIVLFMIFQGLILFFLLIKKTHSISGPVYVMTNQIKTLLDDEDVASGDRRPLRQNDEFKELYSLLGKLTEKYYRALGKNS